MAKLLPAEIDFSECGREPVHSPGSIQSFGVLLVADAQTQRIEQVSDNLQRHIGLAPGEVLGGTLTEVLDADGGTRLRAVLASLSDGAPCLLETPVRPRTGRRGFAARVHRHDGRLLLELEPADAQPLAAMPLDEDLEARLAEARNVYQLSRVATIEARRLTGFDRVMVYRLLGDLGGEVVAEERSGPLMSLLGIRFPPHDFPPQAQRLQVLLGTRLVADVLSPDADLIGAAEAATERPVDLSHSTLRSVSPFCVQYLKGIGVATSLTAGIVTDGTLWGFLSCHHRTARPVGWPVRLALAALGERVTTHVARLAAEKRAAVRARTERRQALIRERAAGAGDRLLPAILLEPPRLMDLLGAGGIALVKGTTVCRRGRTPDVGAVRALAAWVAERCRAAPHGLFHTDTLSALFSPAEAYRKNASGLLALAADAQAESLLLIFRPELRRDVFWAGDPTRPVSQDELKRLHPRSTFERWRQEVAGQARAWEEEDLNLMLALAALLRDRCARQGVPVSTLMDRALDDFRTMLDERSFLREEMLAAVGEGMVLTASVDASGEGRTLSANSHLCALFDLDPTELLGETVRIALDRIGLPSDLLDHPEVEPRDFDLWSETIGLRTIRVCAETIAETCGSGAAHRLVLLRFEDVTEYRRTVAALATLRDQQEAAAEARARFLAGIGHELRSPLNAIIGFAEAIKAQLMGPVGNEVYRSYADDIRQSGQHLLMLIGDLLDLSKLEAGKRLFAEEACDLGGIVTEVFRWSQMQFDKKNLAWLLEVPPEPVLVLGDQGGLRQVVINLLTNAGKFTPPGGRVVCRLSAAEHTDPVLTVEDTGVGIAPEEIESLFQPFMRASSSHRTDQTGTGLGLSICRALVELHEGRIDLSSDGRSGTVVRVILPAHRRLSPQQAAQRLLDDTVVTPRP